MSHDDGGAGVGGVAEEGFDRRGVGAGALEQFGEVAIEFEQPVGDGRAGLEAEAAGLDDRDGVTRRARGFEAGVAGDFEAGIDGEEAHGERLAGIGSAGFQFRLAGRGSLRWRVRRCRLLGW